MDIVCVSISKFVRENVIVKDAPRRSEAVNLLDSANVFDFINIFDCENVFDCVNIFDCENVCVEGRHSSIVVPMEALKLPNVSLWYVSIVITDAAGTPLKAFDETVGGVSP